VTAVDLTAEMIEIACGYEAAEPLGIRYILGRLAAARVVDEGVRLLAFSPSNMTKSMPLTAWGVVRRPEGPEDSRLAGSLVSRTR
jgi:hypothetical protein